MEDRTNRVRKTSSTDNNHLPQRITAIIFIIIEVILAFRLVLKLLGANAESAFVRFIYGVSQVFVAPFQGIFSEASTEGLETTSVFEPGTLIAMIVVAIIAWIVMKLIRNNNSHRTEREVVTEDDQGKRNRRNEDVLFEDNNEVRRNRTNNDVIVDDDQVVRNRTNNDVRVDDDNQVNKY